MTGRSTTARLAVLFAGLAIATMVTVMAGGASPAWAALGLGLPERPDRTWMANGNVYAQALSEDGNTLYIGGKFKQLRDTPPGTPGKTLAVNNVAAINVDSGAPISTWKPNVAGDSNTVPVVRSLAAKNGRVYVGGKFASVDGQPRRNLAAVDASTGAVVGSFAPRVGDSSSEVLGLAANASRLYVGGKFSSVNGTSRGNLAAVDATSGALDTAWRGRTNKLVRKVVFDTSGTTVFAVGAFSSVSSGNSGNIARQSVARFDAATSAVHPWAVPPGQIQTDSNRNNNMTCWDATVTPTRLYLGCGLGPNYSAAFRLDNGNSGDRVWQMGFVGNPQASAMSPDGSRLIVGGHFGINPLDQRVCTNKYLRGLVAIDLLASEIARRGVVDCSWVPSLDQNSRPDYDGAWDLKTVASPSTGKSYLWVGGGFIGVSDSIDPQPVGNGVTEVPQTNLARFSFATP